MGDDGAHAIARTGGCLQNTRDVEPGAPAALQHAELVGTQWELRWPLAGTDQRVGHYDASVRAHVGPLQRLWLSFRDPPSGGFSNLHRKQPFRIEVLDLERRVHGAFSRPAAWRRDCEKVRWRPTEVDLGRRRTTETLMWSEVRVMDEAHLDLFQQVFRHRRPQQAQAERVLQCSPEAFDQRDRTLLPDCPEPLLHPESPQLPSKDSAREAGPSIRHEMRRVPRADSGMRENASKTTPTLNVTRPNIPFTSVSTRRFHLPPCDRLRRHSEHRRRLALRQAEETPD